MTRVPFLAAFVLAVGLSGCGQTTDSKGKALSVTGPGDTSIKQGGSAEVTVSITRTGFSDPVKITFDLPKGVKTKETDLAIPKDETKAKFTLMADKDAEVSDKNAASVTAEGGGKKPEPAKFNIKITK
ncbi:MAG: hypothetical protein K2W96_01835 [Gemmataceae bacterium]|nr:hypothetical protein [Gemmataceae bacterium]